jgi:uncharacterized protein
MTDTGRVREIAGALCANIARGDLGDVLDTLAPTVVVTLPVGEWHTVAPAPEVCHGKDAAAEAFRRRSRSARVELFELRDVLVAECRAVMTVGVVVRHLGTNAVLTRGTAQLLTVSDAGLVTEWHVYLDSGGDARAFGAELDARLFDAVREGDRTRVDTLLGHGANPNHRDPASGLTTFMLAAGLGDAGLVERLLRAGADVFTTDSRAGGTALHKAVQRGDLPTVRTLVEAGAFVDAVASTTGHTPLMDALWYKHPDITGYLLDHNAGVGLSTHYGFSMTEHVEYELGVNARHKDKLLAAKRLLHRRVRSDQARAKRHRLMAAVTDGDVDTVRELLAAGVEVDTRYPVVNGFNDHHTPLLVAARDGHPEIVHALLAAGADVNATEPTFGACPLHKAVYNGHHDIAGILVAAPGVDLDCQGATNGYTPLHDALWHGYEDCARVLVGTGARLDLTGHDGRTPLDVAEAVFGPNHELTRRIRKRSRERKR